VDGFPDSTDELNVLDHDGGLAAMRQDPADSLGEIEDVLEQISWKLQ
jgi:hypothetical protein